MIIAEISQAHDGSLGIAHSYIDALKDTGIDAVKFQTHIAAAESSAYEPFRVKFSYEDQTRFEYWQRMEFTELQWKELKDHCEVCGLEFISSPFSIAAVNLLEAIGVTRYKVGSGEVNNLLLLERIAQTGKPVIVSSGMSSFTELDSTVRFLKTKNIPTSILQCTTAYPTTPAQWGLNVISELKNRYGLPVGFSDHSGEIIACLAAAALGAELFEFHVVFNKLMFGPDAKASIEIHEVKQMVSGIKSIQTSLAQLVDKEDNDSFTDLKTMFEKSLAVNRDLSKGHILTFTDLEAKKPKGYGINAADFQTLIGKPLLNDKKQWDFLTSNDV
ncbi:MAG: N-acetylneuraminate synthase family protein [Chitinophagaceae bacterium]